ncbi:pseudouridylate synthase 7 homolog isoform X2 [Amphiura filiformis]|uniref:pseudouridylate synthase 7 homolog isoform X1 n=1 Tax=Amphiura filiformis TaxID=82378 RepID=UPI003B21E941
MASVESSVESNLKRDALDDDTAPAKRIKSDEGDNQMKATCSTSVQDPAKDPHPNSGESNNDDKKMEENKGGISMEDAERMDDTPELVGLKEKDVGILEYISKHEGFHGVLKQRYRDFLVNEIDEAGNIIRLTDLSYPAPEGEKPLDVNSVLSKEDQEQLAQLLQADDMEASHLIQVGDDKEERTKVHQVIRQLYPSMESTTSDTADGKKVIKVMKAKPGVKRRKSRWPKGRPDFCKFVLYKENMDLNDALGLVARYLHIRPHNFAMAGNKDKRAVTVQEITSYRIDAARIGRLNDVLRGIRMGNFRYVKKALNLGELSGNHFVIVLRNAQCSEQQLTEAMTSFKDVGFINYFGMQRFGNSSIATYMVGIALLKCKWSEAVELILKPREGGSNKEDNKWREHWMKTKNAQSTLDKMPRHKRTSAENQLLTGLMKVQKADPFQALLFIPRHVRLIYIHSFQSYIWNLVLSRRIQKYGLQPIIGDLVPTDNDPSEQQGSGVIKTAYITEENKSEYSIYDVVLPLPGFGIKYPTNEVGEWYKSMMAEHGIDSDKLKHHVKDYSLLGDYRKILVKPKNVTWSIQKYSNYKLHLTQTDLDKLEGTEVPEQTDCTEQAVKMEFSLPSSTYATMAIREILKIDTSSVHQATLNKT